MNRLTLRMNRKGNFMADIPLARQGEHYTVAIGLGGTGIRCLKSLSRQIQINILPDGPEKRPYSRIRLLAVDTDRTFLESLREDPLIERQSFPDRLLNASIIDISEAVSGLIKEALQSCLYNAGLQNQNIWVHVFASLGGVAGGSLLPILCSSLRQMSHEMNLRNQIFVCSYCFLPDLFLEEKPFYQDSMLRNRILSISVNSMRNLNDSMAPWKNFEHDGQKNGSESALHESSADMCFLISAAGNRGSRVKPESSACIDKAAFYALQTISSFTEDAFEMIRQEIISKNANTAFILSDGERGQFYTLALASFEDPGTMLASRLGGELYRRILTRLTDVDNQNALTDILDSAKNDLSEQILENTSAYSYFNGIERRLLELSSKEWSSFLSSAKVGNDGLDLDTRILPEYYAAVAAAEQAMNKNVTALAESWKRNRNGGYSRRLKEWMLKTAMTCGRDTSLHEKNSYVSVENRILTWMNNVQADCSIKEREICSRAKGIASNLQELQSGRLWLGIWGRKNDRAADLIRQAASDRINLSGLRKYRKFLSFLEEEIRDKRDDLHKVGQMAGVLTSVTENAQDTDEHGKISASLLRMYEPILEKMDEEKELDFLMNAFFDSMERKDLFQTDHFFDFASEYACGRLNYLSSRTRVIDRQLREQAWFKYEQDTLRLAVENTARPSFLFSKEEDKTRNARFALITMPDLGSSDAEIREELNNISANAAEMHFCMSSDLKRFQMIRIFDSISMKDYANYDGSKNNMTNLLNAGSIHFTCGDITKQAAECIVNPTNLYLSSNNPRSTDGAIRRAAGPGLAKECSSVRGFHKGQALLTGGYNLPASYIIHVVSPSSGDRDSFLHLRNCYLSALDTARVSGLHQIIFPAIGIGMNGFEARDAAECAIGAVEDWIRHNTGYPMEITFCLYNEGIKKVFENAYKNVITGHRINQTSQTEMYNKQTPSEEPEISRMLREPAVMLRPHAYEGGGKYIFISYSHKNDGEIHDFIYRLQKDGYNVWYDEGINVGDDYAENIVNHIDGCTVFLSMITEEFLVSKNCLDELEYARNEKQEEERFLIFLKEVNIPKKIKLQHSRIQNLHREKEGEYFYYKLYQNRKIRECRDQT